jgi:hypothetical protein
MPSKLVGLFKPLKWSDYGTPRKDAPPKPGQVKTAAFTKAVPSFIGVNFNPVPGATPPRLKLADTVTVTVTLDSSSFVNDWVFSVMDKAFQDSLLHHEQHHYDIGALLARDFFIDVMQLKSKTFASAAAASSDFNAIKAATIDKQRKVEDLYDADTQSGRIAAQQTIWDGFINSAFTTPRAGGGAAPDGTTYKKTLIQVLKDSGKTV